MGKIEKQTPGLSLSLFILRLLLQKLSLSSSPVLCWCLDLLLCLIPQMQALFKQFWDIPELRPGPMGRRQQRGDGPAVLPHSQSQRYAHTEGEKCIPELDFHHRTNISYTHQSQDVVVSGQIKLQLSVQWV